MIKKRLKGKGSEWIFNDKQACYFYHIMPCRAVRLRETEASIASARNNNSTELYRALSAGATVKREPSVIAYSV